MARMLRNLVGVKPDVRNDDLKRYVSVIGINMNFHSTKLTSTPACTIPTGPEPPSSINYFDTTGFI